MMASPRDWLADFVQYASYGEAPLHMLWWVGVSTIAGALRRRVWIDQWSFQWVPNFYIALIAPPAIIAKSTTINVGYDLLREIEGINLGPDITSWQALVQEIGKVGEEFDAGGGEMWPMAAMSCAIDELGTFLDPSNREQVDTLTALWDGKRGTIWKATKTQGHDRLKWPWVNIMACTTPVWLNSNFPESFLGSGHLSRWLFVEASEKRQLVAYPGRRVPPNIAQRRAELVARLRSISELAGPYRMTEAAMDWGEAHYGAHWANPDNLGHRGLGYSARKQAHLHKLAMVVSAARGEFPVIDVEHLVEGDRQLALIEPGINRVFDVIGVSGLTKASRDIVELVRLAGADGVKPSALFGKHFFRRLTVKDFQEALRGALGSGQIQQLPAPSGALVGNSAPAGGSDSSPSPQEPKA